MTWSSRGAEEEEKVIADFRIWNSGHLRLTDRGIYMISYESGVFFPSQDAVSIPWREVQSIGYSESGDPYSLLPWSKVHRVVVRGHMGIGGMEIACKSDAQARQISAAINDILRRRPA
jgi:hypothetical protein